ncbi:MAG: hypothetical protein OCC46_04155 [Pseudodesulfovibrio sp.]
MVRQRLALIDESEGVKILLLESFSLYSRSQISTASFDAFLSNIALALEKLSKLVISIDEYTRIGSVQTNFKNEFSHNLIKLKNKIAKIHERESCRSSRLDEHFIKTDELLDSILEILKEYLFQGKFDTLNTLANPKNDAIKNRWSELEDRIALEGNVFISQHHHKCKKILGTIEKYVRALVRLPFFDCMENDAKQYMSPLMPFLYVLDEELGVRDYKLALDKELGNTPVVIITCSESDFLEKYGSVYSRKEILKSDFNGNWPFLFDKVTIECRDSNCAFIIIDGNYFRLNGTAGTRYKLSCPFSAGVAKVGISISPFIDMALKLCPVADYLKD